MKILSMTATFGKLSRQTLTLNEGLNIINRPNEWGKSTWCAFIMAMLYGIDTRSQSKTGFLADKEHYAPWSGEPMSGSVDILWKGKRITIQRQNKRVTPLGEVKAFETETGIPVQELCVPAPGQVLLGVERSVFERAGFLKLSEMPIKEDESLRRRLNELVTTGDESGASDDLAQKLNKLKNKCRANSTKGLLPEAESKLKETEDKLQRLQAYQQQVSHIRQRQEDLALQEGRLENHRQALRYQEQRQYLQKLETARVNVDLAQQSLLQAEKECEGLPSPDSIRQNLSRLQQLRDTRDDLHTRSQLLPPLPPAPEAPTAFRSKTPEQAVIDARLDAEKLQQLKNALKQPTAYILSGVLAVIGVALAFASQQIPAAAAFVMSGIRLILKMVKHRKTKQQIAALQNMYPGIPDAQWEQAAEHYATAQKDYNQALTERQMLLAECNRRLEETAQAIAAITGSESISRYEELCRSYLQRYDDLQEKQRALQSAGAVLQAISAAGEQIQPPMYADTLELSAQATEEALLAISEEKEQLQRQLGTYMGEMNALGKEETLRSQIAQMQNRIRLLQKYFCALTRAQEALLQATMELQRRFAPRISGRAQELFSKMTGGRYQRLILRPDLSMDSGAENELGEQGTLWRSDGTVDQLYLALRMAVAEELTPDAPLILDDALVRFDDVRLAQTLEILQQMAQKKQIILFTCQSREKDILEKL